MTSKRTALAMLLPGPGLAGLVLWRAGRACARSWWRATMALTLAALLAAGLQAHEARPVRLAARAAANAPFTLAAGWLEPRPRRRPHVHQRHAHAGRHGLGVRHRGGVTVGDVLLTDKDSVDADLLAHEARHAVQWSFLGAFFVPLYLIADELGGGPEDNAFEVSAGLADGGYRA